MKIAILYGPLCLQFRGSFAFDQLRSDHRGLTGSELGFVRIAQELKALGHDVTVFTVAAQTEWEGMRVRPWSESGQDEYDAAIAINEPDLLRGMRARVRVCPFWLNAVSFTRVGFDEHVDLFCSPSQSHLDQVFNNPGWHKVAVSPQHPDGLATFVPDPSKWTVIPLGCDPERYVGFEKIPGKVVHCSSPDRGLHWLLQEWPKVQRSAPHAQLHVFYRIWPWIRQFDDIKYFAPIESQRGRAVFIEDALRRMQEAGGFNVHIHDSVSREQIEREMATAECLGFPCDPVNDYTEGFSCSTLEGCAARACPVITDADALGSIYGGSVPVSPRGDWDAWSDNVIRALTDKTWRDEWNGKAAAFAATHTWALCAKRLESAIAERLGWPAETPTANERIEADFRRQTRFEGTP